MSAQMVLAGRYRLDREIGRGGMGQVWSALDTRLQRQVAVKTVDLSAGGGDDVAAERFRQEAQATAALSHPNIVTIFDDGVDGTTAFLVMELLSGPSLDEMVREHGPLPVDRALDYAQSVASALGAAHARGIVHRDVKPSNLMLDSRGALKMVDFGIARLDQARTSQLTATATVIGSAPYLSPEQATGSTATAQSDLYSLGCVLMTLLTGEPPFEGEHPLSILHHHLSTPAPRPSDRRAGVPAAVDDLVAQLLAKSPQDRPASASDVAARIAAIRRGSTPATTVLPAAGGAAATTVLPPAAGPRPGATAGTPAAPTGAPATAAAVPPAGRRETRRAAREEPRRRGLGAVWFLLALLVATAAALWWFRLGPGDGGSSIPGPSPTTTITRTTTAPATATEEPTSSRPTRSRRPSSSSSAPSTTSEPTSEPTSQPTSTESSPLPTSTSASEPSATSVPTTTARATQTSPAEPTAPATTWTSSATTQAQGLQTTEEGSGLP